MKRKIVVGHFVHAYLFLTGSWIYSQIINLAGYLPIVLTTKVENLEQFPFRHIYCYCQPFMGPGYARLFMRKLHENITRSKYRYYLKILRLANARLLHAHFGTEGYYNLAVARRLKLPLITAFYGSDISRLPRSRPKWRKRYKRLFVEGELFLVEGPFMAQSLVDLGCPPNKIRIQHLGIDVGRIKYIPRVRENRLTRILMVGSFREKKGMKYGILAFAKALRSFPNMELRIIGGAKTPAERKLMQECQQIAVREGIGDKVTFLGYVPYEVYLSEMAHAHLFMAPSVTASDGDSEGGAPVAIIEASAGGMPIIATRHADIPNVVLDGESGILVNEGDVNALSEAIVELASNPDIWITMGRRGRQYVEEKFNVFKQVRRLEKIYDDLLGV